jgi:ADP-heptose:LPS heptosyltransferase
VNGLGVAQPAPPVLVLRALGLGDALTAVPALRGLRALYPNRPVLLAGPAAVSGWLRDQGIVDGVRVTDGLDGVPPGQGLGRHIAVNLHGRGPESHRLLLAGRPDRLVGFDCPAAAHRGLTRWRSDEHEVRRWCRLVDDDGGKCDPADLRLARPCRRLVQGRYVVIHPGAASQSRRWPVDRWTAVGLFFDRKGIEVLVTGTAAERVACRTVAGAGGTDLSGGLDLAELAAVVAGARLLLSGDTGVAHLATAYGIPSVTLFGPTPPDRWGPSIDPHLHTVLYAGTWPGDPHADRVNPALLRIAVPQVVSAAQRLLG